MARLGPNSWGKSAVRVSKVVHGEVDTILDLDVQVLLQGEVEAAYLEADNRGVLPTDTTKNTVYGMAQDGLTEDLEAFATLLSGHMVEKDGIEAAVTTVKGRVWTRETAQGFVGGSSERRLAMASQRSGAAPEVEAGIEGLVVLKTTGSAFSGFPRDEFTVLPEADDRLLSTSVTARWRYATLPADTTVAWERVRRTLLDRFFGDWSASVQHQGWLMGMAVLDAVPEIEEIRFELPNQHHLPFDLGRFGLDDRSVVFQPVSEPYGDIRFTIGR